MNVFGLKGSKIPYNIKESYEHETRKQYPYFAHKEHPDSHYAVCPECGNPIQIIGLYPSKEKNDTSLFARHVGHSIKDLATYDQGKFESCNLANPKEITQNAPKHSEPAKYSYIIELIKNYPEILQRSMSAICGVNLSDKLFLLMLERFIKEDGYKYKYITIYNLPYVVLCLSGNSIIDYQFLQKDSWLKREKRFIDNIQLGEKNNITSKNIHMYCIHKIKNKVQYMVIEIDYGKGSPLQFIREFDLSMYYKTVNKAETLGSKVSTLFHGI